MEYFLGCIVTLITMYLSFKINKARMPRQATMIRYTQAYRMEEFKDMLIAVTKPKPLRKSQFTNHMDSNSTRVLFLNNNAYWIKDNALYMADMIDGQIDEESTRTVDTMGMDKVQLDKTIFIVTRLTEGLNNDSSNSGN